MRKFRYFDHNATAPLHPAARDAWLQACETFIGNPSSPHRIGARAEVALNEARARLGRLLGCDPLDIVWTSGATESNNLAIHHLSRALSRDAELWVSALEHPATMAAGTRHFGERMRVIPATRDGVIDLDWMRKAAERHVPGAVCVMAANNVTGVWQPWRDMARWSRDRGVVFMCDAVQWLGREPAAGLGECDFVSGCAHKVGGPRGIGFLKCPGRGVIEPLIVGGPQEDGRRAGTENVAGALALVTALEAREARMEEAAERRRWRDAFEQELLERVPGTRIMGAGQNRLWNTVAAMMPEMDCRKRWVVRMDRLGFAVSSGSACSSGSEAPSPALLAMGCAPDEAGRVLRFSSGWETTREDWCALLEGLVEASRAAG
jgi:cysteine desulfurase